VSKSLTITCASLSSHDHLQFLPLTTIISGTNRAESLTSIVTQELHEYAVSTHADTQIVDLAKIDMSFISPAMYKAYDPDSALRQLQDESLLPAERFVILAPEYNGSIPGMLKLFLDAVSVHRYKETFSGKKVAMMGISTGRAGNLRGLDHLAAICAHVGMTVYPDKRPVSQVASFLNDSQDAIADDAFRKSLHKWWDGFMAF